MQWRLVYFRSWPLLILFTVLAKLFPLIRSIVL